MHKILFVFVVGARKINAKHRAMETMRKRSLNGLNKRTTAETELNPTDLLNLPKDESLQNVYQSNSAVGTKIEKMRQTYKGTPIFDAVVAIEIDKNGKLTGDASGMFVEGIQEDLPSAEPLITEEEALQIALKSENDVKFRRKLTNVKTEHYIYLGDKERAHSIYYVRYFISESKTPRRQAFIIDTKSGQILRKWNDLQTASCGARTYKAYGGNEKMGKIKYGETPYCLEPTIVGNMCFLENEFVRVIDMESTRDDSKNDTAKFECSKGYDDEVNGAYSPAIDAFFYGTQVGKMFREWFGSTPLREKVIIRVHYGSNMENAFWDGETTSFGDGQSTFYPLTSADVVGHEIGHGVTEQASGLVYHGESGGLNEAFSDILGEATEKYFKNNDMKVGDDIKKEGIFRDFRDPEIDGSSVGHVEDFHDSMDPHYSSGVYRRVFFVMIIQKGISIKQAVKVLLQANRVYWRERSGFEDAGCGVIKASYDVGQNPTPYVRALDDVGVTACDASHHIRAVETNVTYSDLTVSNEVKPLFRFNSPNWADVVTVRAASGSGDVKITLRVGTWQDDEVAREDLKIIEEGYNLVNIDRIANEVIYIEFSLEGENEYNDVSISVGYTCLEGYSGNDMQEYRLDCQS
ncbi:hypothetical protein KUTeg_013048 [Tegillarca granosa]|uniref:Neutral metalloproteinase n=1 Tax=Tegillarca granosa TaxID=220873 RepID=A0ABQ9ESZ7_TEGGR|nr:hypothetical protein KUTeg_013048 [Tegillarca granosa]